mgnify:CR=1 FL=1
MEQQEKQIRENITPRGDGNFKKEFIDGNYLNKREYNSERRRKLFLETFVLLFLIDKREYNSERRRKLSLLPKLKHFHIRIRENITPRGDGNTNGCIIN